MEDIIIYTDGGCSGNPGPGGWGYAVLNTSLEKDSPGYLTTGSGGEKCTTNNRMELSAVINALTYVTAPAINLVRPGDSTSPAVSIYTDSQYVQKGITQWITGWKRNGWRTSAKEPVKNQDLWIQLDTLVQAIHPRWVWVKGHAGITYNELVDNLTQVEIAKFRN